MSGREGIGDFNANFENGINLDRAAVDAMLQGLAFEQLHDDERSIIVFADIVNGADIGMVQGGSGASFALKAFEGLRIGGRVFGKEFKGYAVVEAGIFGAIDHAHAAAT